MINGNALKGQIAEQPKNSTAQFHDISRGDELAFRVVATGSAGRYHIDLLYTAAEKHIRCSPLGFPGDPELDLYFTHDAVGRLVVSLHRRDETNPLGVIETAQFIMKMLWEGANRKDEYEAEQWDPNDG
jgi:hypothetical protein